MITKRTKIMLAVLVVVALGAYAYLYWWSRTPDHGYLDSVPALRDASQSASDAVIRPQSAQPGAPGVSNEETPTPQTYQTYENTEFGFSFSYPDTWTASATSIDPETTICLKVKDSTGDCLATVVFEKESINMSLEKVLTSLRTEYRAGTITESNRTVGGERATQLRISGYPEGEENSTRASAFVHDMQVYTITGAPGQEAVYDRITSSFRFQ